MPQRVPQDGSDNTPDIMDAGERSLRVGHNRPIRISSGHRIQDHDGKCSRPHGHNYEIAVTVTGQLTDEGWVVDKSDVTDIIDEWDHRFLLERGDPLIEAFEEAGDGNAVVVIDHPPTAEVMSILLEQRMLEAFPETVRDVSVSVAETRELISGF